VIRHDNNNGIFLEGSEGRIFVNRGKLAGRPVDDLVTIKEFTLTPLGSLARP